MTNRLENQVDVDHLTRQNRNCLREPKPRNFSIAVAEIVMLSMYKKRTKFEWLSWLAPALPRSGSGGQNILNWFIRSIDFNVFSSTIPTIRHQYSQYRHCRAISWCHATSWSSLHQYWGPSMNYPYGEAWMYRTLHFVNTNSPRRESSSERFIFPK